ncbi:Arylsulfatase A [Zobellia uliginosa]|uniref:Arylsulfatase A n=1 Tax=Zobellia uliginosa TaxID=143224 RepID=A0ABY1KWL4_9FLAO|nr:sulfatase [Zobellia uliginosa]SIS86911.1 Arylsulfatase A [Zobellia uliginosa]
MFRYFSALYLLLGLTNLSAQTQDRPNVLFICVDDLRTELGAYGKHYVKSPHIDALAKTGALFTNHYVQVPTCGASRHAILTGMRPSKPIHLSNNSIVEEISGQPEKETPETFIHRFKQDGYHTVGIGKISHSADGLVYGYEAQPSEQRELPHSWSELLFDPGKWKTGWNSFFAYANGENRQSLKKQVKPYEAGETDDQGYPDGLTADLAISKLKELKKKGQPFFMGVGFFKPHLPFNAPKKYWDLYDENRIPLSPNPDTPKNINLKSLHGSGEFNQYALGEEKAGLDTQVSDAYARKLRHGYLASISYIDAQIGKLYQELKALELDQNTIIVIWGDHGWHLGDQRVWGKHTLFENALKSTLIINSPLRQHKAKKVRAIVESVDVYPTLLDMCGIDQIKPTDGESFEKHMKYNIPDTEEVAYSYFKNGISMRTKDYRLTKYFRKDQPIIELYDHHKANAIENKNIADEKPEIVKKLMPLLNVGDTGLYNASE